MESASSMLSGVNTPTIAMMIERRKKIMIVSILLILGGEFFQKLNANHVHHF
jgi:hypothetical protein